MTRLIKFNGLPIGEQTPLGKTLDKTAFFALRKTDRLRAYLLLAWPQARRGCCLAKICHVTQKDLKNYLKSDLKDGVVVCPARGLWIANPVRLATGER